MVLGEHQGFFSEGLLAPVALINLPSVPPLRNPPGTVQTIQTQEILGSQITESCALEIIPNSPSLETVEAKTEGDGKGLPGFATRGWVLPSSVDYSFFISKQNTIWQVER